MSEAKEVAGIVEESGVWTVPFETTYRERLECNGQPVIRVPIPRDSADKNREK